MSTPQRFLETLFVLDDEGRIHSAREPSPSHGPLFSLVRSATTCAWAAHADVPASLADELNRLAQQEPPILDLREPPINADRYMSLVGRQIGTTPGLFAGPAFFFPDSIAEAAGGQSVELAAIEDERLLAANFSGWVPGEIAAGRSPMLAVIEDGLPVSICFCARRSDVAAEAGLETAEAYRGRGYGRLVTAAWARAVQATGRTPLYSTSWENHASLAVARKLGLMVYASGWSLSG